MNLTEKEAERALNSLSQLRREYDDFRHFRDELEISHLKGHSDSCHGAKVVISKSEHRTFSLNMPYDYLMKWILGKMEFLKSKIDELESKFKIEE